LSRPFLRGALLLVGVDMGEHFLGADAQVLVQVTNRMIDLKLNDVVEITCSGVQACGLDDQPVERSVRESELPAEALERGEYRRHPPGFRSI
jgi:glucosamine--fructose-6-phosphate aminotransferase (isomerizing)